MARPWLSVVRHPAVPGIEAVHGRRVPADIVRHAHARLVVGLCLDGARRIVSGSRQWTVAPGEGFVIPPGVPHACPARGGTTPAYLVLALDPGLLPAGRRGVDGARDRPWLWRDAVGAELLVAVAGALRDAPLRAASLAVALVETLDVRLAPLPAPHPATLRAKALVDAAPDASLTLAGLAEAAGVSPFRLERLFGHDLGVSPGQYVLSRRVDRAAACIIAGAPLCEAALAAGFCDQSHLSRQFRRRMGVPPGRFAGERPADYTRKSTAGRASPKTAPVRCAGETTASSPDPCREAVRNKTSACPPA